MRRRIMLNMELGRCQLSKLYAYNGLLFSSGTRVDGIRIDKKHRVIVIDNPTKRVERASVITLREGREPGTFYRADTLEDLDITCFDGVGLISKEYAARLNKTLGCRRYLERHIQPKLAVQCAAALGKRSFLWDVLLDAVLATARKEERRD